MKKVSGLNFIGICAASGTHARHAAEKFSFRYCATDEAEIINDPAVNTIVIATRHHLHAPQVVAALQAGKHVFCEKPLCLDQDELSEIIQAYNPSQAHLMAGFNRRFAPMVREMKLFVENIHEPLAMHYRITIPSRAEAEFLVRCAILSTCLAFLQTLRPSRYTLARWRQTIKRS